MNSYADKLRAAAHTSADGRVSVPNEAAYHIAAMLDYAFEHGDDFVRLELSLHDPALAERRQKENR